MKFFEGESFWNPASFWLRRPSTLRAVKIWNYLFSTLSIENRNTHSRTLKWIQKWWVKTYSSSAILFCNTKNIFRNAQIFAIFAIVLVSWMTMASAGEGEESSEIRVKRGYGGGGGHGHGPGRGNPAFIFN
jgi:hypothetical protein